MTEHRFEAYAAIEPGECELRVDESRAQLLRVGLTDAGAVTRDDGSSYVWPDVVCPLRPSEARELGLRLWELADRCEVMGRGRAPMAAVRGRAGGPARCERHGLDASAAILGLVSMCRAVLLEQRAVEP